MTKFPLEIENCDLDDGRILEELEQICFPGAARVRSAPGPHPGSAEGPLLVFVLYIEVGYRFHLKEFYFLKNVDKVPTCVIFILSINN